MEVRQAGTRSPGSSLSSPLRSRLRLVVSAERMDANKGLQWVLCPATAAGCLIRPRTMFKALSTKHGCVHSIIVQAMRSTCAGDLPASPQHTRPCAHQATERNRVRGAGSSTSLHNPLSHDDLFCGCYISWTACCAQARCRASCGWVRPPPSPQGWAWRSGRARATGPCRHASPHSRSCCGATKARPLSRWGSTL